MNKKDRNHDRAPGMRGVSIAVPNDLLEQIGAIAKKERRTRNSMIRIMLEDAVDATKATRPNVDTPSSSMHARVVVVKKTDFSSENAKEQKAKASHRAS